MKRINRGFTLIELLIVVAIIGILAAIAIPNFLQAQTRAKVSRFKADIRSAGLAMESYMVDHNTYPPADGIPVGVSGNAWIAPPVGPAEGFITRRLSTPISYISSLPIDIFPNTDCPCAEYGVPSRPHYSNDQFNRKWYSDPAEQFFVGRLHAGLPLQREPAFDEFSRSVIWVIHSHGPDHDHDDFESEQGYPTEYDPTNGAVSDGDIFYWGPGRGFKR